ncbi:PmoA family protein [Bacillus alkalicellulosilyticus]|uniref:DUF6807 domain-containing protein n=1 Tax=Alkalihalobacterium alkalicellulosilyticum TaxID=1912214 RepID=UPI0009966B46|nr:PmoA family protein [Bacillus alkalicellulosilyticus]
MAFKSKYSEQDALWEVTLNGTKILEYVYGAEGDINPSFRLVKTTGDHTITIYRPWDHPWHPGLFFSWKYINGFNFWEAKYHGEDNKVKTDSFSPLADGQGFEQTLTYITQEEQTVVNETRIIRLEEDGEGYLIHWDASFTTPENEITFDRTEQTKEAPWGGYAGLSCRLHRNYLGPTITTDLGEFTADDAHAKSFKWCDYAGKLDGYTEEQWAGICLIDHPANERHPSPKLTYDYKDMQFLSAAFLFDKPYVLKKGETLRLQYTFYVHDGKIQKESMSNILDRLL